MPNKIKFVLRLYSSLSLAECGRAFGYFLFQFALVCYSYLDPCDLAFFLILNENVWSISAYFNTCLLLSVDSHYDVYQTERDACAGML